MNTPAGAAASLLVLSASGALPALALARSRLVTIPLAPLTGSVVAGLSVTAMTGIGGTMVPWYAAFSVLGAAVSVMVWWLYPRTRPWARRRTKEDFQAKRIGVIAFAVTAGVCAFGLTELVNPVVSYDGRAIWMLHPLWYEAGHTASVAALRNAALVFAHPQYPPLTGGVVALSWRISGLNTVRLGVVMIALLNALAILAASTGVMDLARRLVPSQTSGENRRRRTVVLGIGAALSVLLALTAFRGAGTAAVDGHADLLWAACAVGAVTYGLLLPWTKEHLGAAILLAAVAGTTKSEGTLTAAAIIVLIAVRGVLVTRSRRSRLGYVRPVAFGLGSLLVIGAWPIVTHLLHALPNLEMSGPSHDGSVGNRFVATVQNAAPHLEVLTVAVPVALAGAVFLQRRRRAAGVGADWWGWAALVAGLAVTTTAYVTGPGPIQVWLAASVQRTMLFPLLAAWWIVAAWVVIATGEIRNPRSTSVDQA